MSDYDTRTHKGVPADRDAILDGWVTVEEAAIVAGVPIATVILWIEQGKVEAFYVAAETTTIH